MNDFQIWGVHWVEITCLLNIDPIEEVQESCKADPTKVGKMEVSSIFLRLFFSHEA